MKAMGDKTRVICFGTGRDSGYRIIVSVSGDTSNCIVRTGF